LQDCKMVKPILIALDAMGGDIGPEAIVSGAAMVLARRPEIRFAMFGNEKTIEDLVNVNPELAAATDIHHAEISVRMDEKPSQAIRSSRGQSSMWKAIESIKSLGTSAVVSAGNTGALMSMAVLCLRTMSGINRPAIAATWPTIVGKSLVLDVGANVTANAQQLASFAVMGASVASSTFGVSCPRVALLNMGTEEAKGDEDVRNANLLLHEYQLPFMEYIGFVEANDIGAGAAHVVVTSGFAGNVAIKTAEGTVKQISHYIRDAFSRNWFSKITGFVAKRTIGDFLSNKLNPAKLNGGLLLGLNGIVVKSHGGADAAGTAAAIELACDMVNNTFLSQTAKRLQTYKMISDSSAL